MIKSLHFDISEFKQRKKNILKLLDTHQLDGLLLFKQESMYYLSGYDTFGYVFFQCLILTADGKMVLLTRLPDLRQAQHTSILEDIRIWKDQDNANPCEDLRDILDELGLRQKKLGVEYEAYGLTAANGLRLNAQLKDFCQLEDASNLVNQLRVIKSNAEIDYIKQAAKLSDQALNKVMTIIAPGVSEARILAELQAQILKGDGDYPANEFIVGSGHHALLCRYYSGRRNLSKTDQLTLEYAGVYRHYHAAMMRTILLGHIDDKQIKMHNVAVEAMNACMDKLKPGCRIAEVFDAYASVCDKAGMRAHRMNATGYSMGSTFSPNWMDWPMIYANNPIIIAPNMVFFLHMILMDSESGFAMCPGHSVLVTQTSCQALSALNLDLLAVD